MPRASLLSQLICGEVPRDVALTVDDWWAMHRGIGERFVRPADVALAAGFAADRPGWAFASGYRAALRALVPNIAIEDSVALAVTEGAGNHPRAITTTLSGDEGDGGEARLDGVKTFVTLGAYADTILVLATRGLGEDGRPRLVMVSTPREADGVSLEELPALPFIPEVPHARVAFEGVAIPREAIHVGDGYADYAKPFRTVEDAHVHLAIIGWFLRVARLAGAPAGLQSELLTLATTAHGHCEADPKDPMLHVLLAGTLSHVSHLARSPRLWDAVDDPTRALWNRDRALLQVAGDARKARLERALLTLGR